MTSLNIDEADLPMFSRASGADVGYIYCLSNPAMPGLVKIGYTNRSTRVRAFELSFGTRDSSATGVPLPFEVVKDWRVPGSRAEQIEQQIHRALHKHRVPSHGRGKPKEFFYFEPAQAVLAIERALQALDWWEVAQAEEARFQLEVAERGARRAAEAAREQAIAETEQKIKDEVTRQQAAWRQDASQRKASDGRTEGIKWGAIWFIGTWIFFAMMGAKDTVGWACFGVGIFVYFMNRDGPAREYLSSQGARDEMDKIEVEIRRRLVRGQTNNVNCASVPIALPAPTPDHQPTGPRKLSGLNFQEVGRQTRADVAHQAWIGGEIEKITSLSREHAAKAGLATAAKIIAAHFENWERAAYESNICAMLRNSPPLQLSQAEALAICRLVEGDVYRRWGWPLPKDNKAQGGEPSTIPAPVAAPVPLPIQAPAPASASASVPVLKKFKAVCPHCKLVLAARMDAPDLSRKILCPSCSNVFLFGERSKPNRVQREPGNDMDSLYRDFE